MIFTHPILQEWKGKWVFVHLTFTLLVSGTHFCGRLKDYTEDVLVMECGGIPYLIDGATVLALYLAVNQDDLTLANMQHASKLKP